MTRPWNEIRRTYQTLVDNGLAVRGMLKLVEATETSPYVNGLHAWTSMYDLCIVQAPVIYPYQGPYLRISPLFDGNIEFRYLDTPDVQKQWHRIVPEDEAFQRLVKFLDQLHWFTREEV